MTTTIKDYLEASATIDCDHASITAFAARHTIDAGTPREQAMRLYYAVRDSVRYNPYDLTLSVAGLRASTTLAKGQGWCVAKAILLAAGCRACGIPARLGFADVRNHLSTQRMREAMQTDVFFWHGYCSIFLDGVWVKATPAFNIELCERLKLRPLEFDGRTDALFHPFDLDGQRHMEYLRYLGEFAEVPLDQIIATFRREYRFDPLALTVPGADFEQDVAEENQG